MKKPFWYRDAEKWLLKRGKPAIVFGLVAQIGVAGYLTYRLVVLNKQRLFLQLPPYRYCLSNIRALWKSTLHPDKNRRVP